MTNNYFEEIDYFEGIGTSTSRGLIRKQIENAPDVVVYQRTRSPLANESVPAAKRVFEVPSAFGERGRTSDGSEVEIGRISPARESTHLLGALAWRGNLAASHPLLGAPDILEATRSEVSSDLLVAVREHHYSAHPLYSGCDREIADRDLPALFNPRECDEVVQNWLKALAEDSISKNT